MSQNPEKLNKIKDKLVSNLSSAPLFNTNKFKINLETFYELMYEKFQKKLEPDHINFEH